MDFKYRHTGKIKDGKRVYDDPNLLQRHLLSLEGEDFEEYTRKKRVSATGDQMNFYIGVVLKEAHRHNEFIHYESPKRLHDLVFAPIFLTEYIVADGKLKTKTRKLSELNKDEMWELTERVIAYLLTEYGIEIAEKKNYHYK
jgi:hypothetical protein